LVQTGLLKIPRIRKALNMPIAKKRSAPAPSNNKGFVKEIKECEYCKCVHTRARIYIKTHVMKNNRCFKKVY